MIERPQEAGGQATNPFRNPAVACEMTMREREALMAADDWDPILDKVLLLPTDGATTEEAGGQAIKALGRFSRKRRMRWALLTIGTSCSNFTRGRCSDKGSGRTPDCDYTAGRWCDQCIAREGLRG